MRRAVGMPDLHPGKGAPIGAVFACAGWVYPYLIGNDIGCGMSLWATDVQRNAVKLDRWERRLDLDGPWSGDASVRLAESRLEPTPHDAALGTIGLGNHLWRGRASAAR
jgi:release factor H-coupled RctB family protein